MKKLNLDFLNETDVLSREEKKNILAGSGSGGSGGGGCSCQMGGCSIVFYQNPNSWFYYIQCSGYPMGHYTGSGQYGGTLCGGACP